MKYDSELNLFLQDFSSNIPTQTSLKIPQDLFQKLQYQVSEFYLKVWLVLNEIALSRFEVVTLLPQYLVSLSQIPLGLRLTLKSSLHSLPEADLVALAFQKDLFEGRLYLLAC